MKLARIVLTTMVLTMFGFAQNGKQIIELPKGDAYTYEQLAYQQDMDVILGDYYAFLAYKQTDDEGNWKVVIKGNKTAGTSAKPGSVLRNKAARAAKKGKTYFLHGFDNLREEKTSKKKNDGRVIEHRFYFNDDLEITHVKMVLQTRKADGSPRQRIITSFDWPGFKGRTAEDVDNRSQ
jgi:hypothetical protein